MDVRSAAAGLPPNPHGQELATVGIIMCIVAGLLVVARMLTRIFMANAVGWDDYTLAFSMLLAVGMATCFQMEVHYGMGLHTAQVKNPHDKWTSLLWLWINQILYKVANGSIKISIALLYLRIFPSQRFKYTVWVFIGFVCTYCTAAILPSVFQCKPIAKSWNKSLDGHCIDVVMIWYINSAMTLLADTVLIVLPIPNIMRLQLPKAQRIALVFVFSLGIFVMVTTIVRLVSLSPLASANDLLWYQASSNSWAFLEIDVSIICASIPILRAPIQRLFPRILGKITTRNVSGNTPHYQVGNGGRPHDTSAISMQNRSEWQKSSGYAHGTCDVLKDDAASDEEHILGPEGIRKTMEVRFDYDEIERSRSRTPGQ